MSYDYEFLGTHRKIAIIVSNGYFQSPDLPDRKGYQEDLAALQVTFHTLGFQIEAHSDVTKEKLLEILERAASEDHSVTACLVVVISSHGGQRETSSPDEDEAGMEGYKLYEAVDIIHATDQPLEMAQVLDAFNESNCPTLSGKPKLFFVQSSRGDQLCETVTVKSDGATIRRDQYVIDDVTSEEDGKPTQQTDAPSSGSEKKPVGQGTDTPSGGSEEKIVSRRTDIRRDYLLMWSAPPGYISFRQPHGSPFILTLCEVLRSMYEDTDLLTMLTEVCRRVATEFESRTQNPVTNRRHMMPSIEHMLRKAVFFSSHD